MASEIARLHAEDGVAYSDMAIMYRANAQSRSLEEALINAGLPYQLIGGTKFYERKEIKDALAYLQAILNPADDVNLRRILNVPKRGLGRTRRKHRIGIRPRTWHQLLRCADAYGTDRGHAYPDSQGVEGVP